MKTLLNYALDPDVWGDLDATDQKKFAPSQANHNDMGFDLRTPEPFCLYQGDSKFVDLGIAFEFPGHQWGMLVGRSGLAKKQRIAILNGVGIIDPGYRGNVGAMFINHGPDKHCFSRGDRVAQLVVVSATRVYLDCTSPINKTTERGARGFGSSGQ